jgi:hypothetical protein
VGPASSGNPTRFSGSTTGLRDLTAASAFFFNCRIARGSTSFGLRFDDDFIGAPGQKDYDDETWYRPTCECHALAQFVFLLGALRYDFSRKTPNNSSRLLVCQSRLRTRGSEPSRPWFAFITIRVMRFC